MDSKNSNDNFFNNIQIENGIKYYIIKPGATFYRADNPTKEGNTVVFNFMNRSILPGNPEKKFDERTFDSPPSSPVKNSNTEKNKLPIFPYLFFSPSYESIEANYGKTPIFKIENTQTLKLIALDQDQPKLFELLKDEKPDLSNNEITNNIMRKLDPIKNKSIKQLLVDHFAFNEDGKRDTAKCRLSVSAVDKFMAIYFSNGRFEDFDGYGCNLITCHDPNDHFHSEFTIKNTRNKIDVIGIVSKNSSFTAPSIKKGQNKAPPSSRKRNIPPPTPKYLSYSSSKKGSRPSSILNLGNEFEILNMNTPSKKRTLFSPTKLENNLNSSFGSPRNLDTMFDSPTSPVRVRGGKKKKTHKSKRKTKKSRKSSRKTKRKTKKRRC